MDDRRGITYLSVWLFAASSFTYFGGLRVLPPPFPQAVLVALVGLLFACYALRPEFRRWVDGRPSRDFLLLHLSRFVGAYFLVLYERGLLPYEFAVLGGWGDICVASLALVLLLVFRGGPATRSLPFQAWNLLGLADILFVVITAARLAVGTPGSMARINYLPLGLLPTFLVPLIIFTHGVVLYRALHRTVPRDPE
ncbi:MAG: hypothetical protein L0Z55_13265 [Planctomycetes bacterium]|nr:hypothetical protein [Planctomycetota bacterium]